MKSQSCWLQVHGKTDTKLKFSGRRVKRGLYKSKNGTLINADLNGSANILRKVFPKAFGEGIEVVVVQLGNGVATLGD